MVAGVKAERCRSCAEGTLSEGFWLADEEVGHASHPSLSDWLAVLEGQLEIYRNRWHVNQEYDRNVVENGYIQNSKWRQINHQESMNWTYFILHLLPVTTEMEKKMMYVVCQTWSLFYQHATALIYILTSVSLLYFRCTTGAWCR